MTGDIFDSGAVAGVNSYPAVFAGSVDLLFNLEPKEPLRCNSSDLGYRRSTYDSIMLEST